MTSSIFGAEGLIWFPRFECPAVHQLRCPPSGDLLCSLLSSQYSSLGMQLMPKAQEIYQDYPSVQTLAQGMLLGLLDVQCMCPTVRLSRITRIPNIRRTDTHCLCRSTFLSASLQCVSISGACQSSDLTTATTFLKALCPSGELGT